METSFKKYSFLLLLFTCLLFAEALQAQFDIPDKPSKADQTSVYDYIGLLDEGDKNALKRKLINYADTTSTQIVVVIIGSANSEDLSFLGAKWGQQWGIGQADEDNGILILLARDDRRVDINTGYGIEYRITDRMAEQIINQYMIPEFKKGNYYGGLDKGTDVMIQMLEGEFKGEDPASDFPYGPVIVIGLFILFWIVMISASRKGRGGRNGGSGRGTGSLWDIIILSNAGRTGGSWSGGSSGSGSFGSGGFGGGFGGGGFGGGGASGSW